MTAKRLVKERRQKEEEQIESEGSKQKEAGGRDFKKRGKGGREG